MQSESLRLKEPFGRAMEGGGKQGFENEAGFPLLLLPCPTCFRTFKPESLERHRLICEKMVSKKRRVFDSSKQRGFQGTETVKTPVSIPTPTAKKLPKSRIPTTTDWREKHLDLIRSVREVRMGDYNRCPYCERNFGLKAYDRHVDWCKEQQARIPKSPPSSEAKERWEARTKYRAPSLRRSMRSMSREKYSPSRQLSSSASEAPSSLSGSRASLDSRPSSIISYNNDTHNNNGNAYLSKSPPVRTMERTYTGNNFNRNTNERRSLRIPSSTTSPVPLSHINNNRTSALRASLRMKNSSSWNDSLSPTYAKSTPYTSSTLRSEVLPAVKQATKIKTAKPSVLQLFTSAFSRNSPVSKVAPRSVVLPSSQARVGPEGVESKMMTSSCSPVASMTASSTLKNKPPRIGSSASYNPYLSAERQMKELFNDKPSGGTPRKAPSWPEKSSSADNEQVSMEQLEQDLKDILSEISQLGQQETSVSSSSSRSSTGEQQLPKFCHACGSAYPEGALVKFCCECGARRLYV